MDEEGAIIGKPDNAGVYRRSGRRSDGGNAITAPQMRLAICAPLPIVDGGMQVGEGAQVMERGMAGSGGAGNMERSGSGMEAAHGALAAVYTDADEGVAPIHLGKDAAYFFLIDKEVVGPAYGSAEGALGVQIAMHTDGDAQLDRLANTSGMEYKRAQQAAIVGGMPCAVGEASASTPLVAGDNNGAVRDMGLGEAAGDIHGAVNCVIYIEARGIVGVGGGAMGRMGGGMAIGMTGGMGGGAATEIAIEAPTLQRRAEGLPAIRLSAG